MGRAFFAQKSPGKASRPQLKYVTLGRIFPIPHTWSSLSLSTLWFSIAHKRYHSYKERTVALFRVCLSHQNVNTFRSGPGGFRQGLPRFTHYCIPESDTTPGTRGGSNT